MEPNTVGKRLKEVISTIDTLHEYAKDRHNVHQEINRLIQKARSEEASAR